MTSRLPLFPLETVLFPGQPLPLHVFEERYRRLVRRLRDLEPDRRRFGVVAIRVGREVGTPWGTAAAPCIHDVGCVAHVRDIEAYDDGRFDLVAVGGRRFRLIGLESGETHLFGQVEYLSETDDDVPEAAVLLGGLSELATNYLGQLAELGAGPDITSAHPMVLSRDPRTASFEVATTLVLDVEERQRLLATPRTADRLRLEIALLRREIALLGSLHAVPAGDLLRRRAPGAWSF